MSTFARSFSVAAITFSGFCMTASAVPDATQDLYRLFDERLQWQLRESPEFAMSRGDYTYADRIGDTSIDAIERRHQETSAMLERVRAIDSAALSEADRTNKDLFELELWRSVEGHTYRSFLMPLGGRSGPQQDVPQMIDRVRFETEDDFRNYLKRLELVPKLIDDTIELMELGVKEGRTPAAVTMMGLPSQFNALTARGGLDILRNPLVAMPESIPTEARKEILAQFDTTTFPAVKKAMAKLENYFLTVYLGSCRDDIAATSLPDGEAYYNFQIRQMTTTDMTARQIHELGLSEVARIKAEMMEVIRRTDFPQKEADGSSLYANDHELFKAFINYLRTDERFYHRTPEALLAGYRDICKQVDAWLPKLFKRLPRLPYGVREIPPFMAPTQTTAYYQPGDIRNAEAGYFYANTYKLEQRPTYEMIALAIHEAVPGHHLQIALAQEMENQPEFRKDLYFNAFGEGWALYSERLGIEMGMYKDPYDDFGRLLYEMWRACRLVVDPGMHALGWSRDKAVAFMMDNTALSELNINTEIDRYINWPGQATSYKIGELKIRQLRGEAEERLGVAFDLRAFHDVVLGEGSVPLTILERRVHEWIELCLRESDGGA